MGLENFILTCEKDNQELSKNLEYYKNRSSRLKKENETLKKQVEELSKNYNLDISGIYIVNRNDEIIRLDKKALEYLRSLEQKNYTLKIQQKELINYLEKIIIDSNAGSGQQYYYQVILQKYKEIIGDDK